jgi:hypothetical protein
MGRTAQSLAGRLLGEDRRDEAEEIVPAGSMNWREAMVVENP